MKYYNTNLRWPHPEFRMTRPYARLTLAALLIAAFAPAANADVPQVVASIKPVHSLVAGVMGDLGTPSLLVSGADSPHTYSMKPSEASALSRASVVFWIGEELETFLAQPIANLGANARSVALIDTPGLTVLQYEDDGHGAERHDHDAGGEVHGQHHDHRHSHGDHHGGGHGHGDAAHADHDHEGADPHVWLDPRNAIAMVRQIAATLAETDPEHADTYRANAEALIGRLHDLEHDIAERLAPYLDVPYLTFHEAFRYFDARFGLDGRGAITVNPERQPSARRLGELRDMIGGFERVCIFAEPQFPPRLVNVIVEGTAARVGTLDPLGAELEPGADLYLQLLRLNSDSFAECFAATM